MLQDGLLEPIWTQHGPKLAPSWFKLCPCWPQVGSNMTQVGPMLDPDPGPQPPLSQPKRPSPSKPLPCGLWACQTPMDSKKAPKPPTSTSTTPNLDPQRLQHGSKRHLPRLPILLPRHNGWGVASLIKYVGFRIFLCTIHQCAENPIQKSLA